MCVHWLLCLQINLFFPPLLSYSLPSSVSLCAFDDLMMSAAAAVADVIEKLISTPIVFNAKVPGQIFLSFVSQNLNARNLFPFIATQKALVPYAGPAAE